LPLKAPRLIEPLPPAVPKKGAGVMAGRRAAGQEAPESPCMAYLEGYPPMLTPKQVSSVLQICERTIRFMCRSGEFEHSAKVGTAWRIPKASVAAFIERGGVGRIDYVGRRSGTGRR